MKNKDLTIEIEITENENTDLSEWFDKQDN